jgi:predicted transcriptional regulator
MRIRESLIIEETILKKIDEIAGEKHRRAATIERALTEFIAREEKKAKGQAAGAGDGKIESDRSGKEVVAMKAVEAMSDWDVEKIRKDFPVLSQTVNGKPLVYLDNGASSQVPQSVIDRTSKYLAEEHSNIPPRRALSFAACNDRIRSGA